MTEDFVPRSEFLRTLKERGYIHQCSDWQGLDDKAASGNLVAYIGFDCTAPSLHVGSLIPIMLLRQLQKTGGKPIVLMGTATTRVGDPSGKDESRKLLDSDDILRNKESIFRVFSRFLTFGNGKTDAIVVDNADWLDKLHYIDFLRNIGRHFSVNRMLSMDSVKRRVERDQELSFLEFNYMCLQAYDFVELNRRYDCVLQMGGSDQWGNIVTGIDLGRRLKTQALFGLTAPLLTTASGAKMGKTATGAVWLSEDMLKPYDYWQFWRNVDDADVERFLKLFTELPLDEIADLAAKKGSEINEAKKKLATKTTELLHGEKAAKTAEISAEIVRRLNEKDLGERELSDITAPITLGLLESGLGVLEAFLHAGLVASKGEARRQILNGGLRVNDEPVKDEATKLYPSDLRDGVIKLSLGRKRHMLLKPYD